MSAAFSMSSISGQSVRDVIDQRAAQAPNQVFLIDPTTRQTLTFRDLHDAARVFAARLKAEGCQPGDRIAYHLHSPLHDLFVSSPSCSVHDLQTHIHD